VEPLQAGDPLYVGIYRLTGRLGAGGMGRVFLGVSPGGRKVAVKLVLPEHSADPGFRQRFAREVAAARQVGGFHTAPVVDADPAADPPWMVTAYIPGPSLDEVVRSAGPLDPSSLRALGAGLAEGLGAVHAAGLIHRDLKPANVIMAEDGPRIIDFGIARAADATPLTSSGVLIGTFSFMSPEQVRGERLGPESDIFSLGGVLAYAATGRGPFDSPTVPAIIHRIVTEPPDLGSLSGPLRSVISACLAKNPADRPTLHHLLSVLSDVPGQFAPSRQLSVPVSPRTPPPGATLPPAQATKSTGGRGTQRFPTAPAWGASAPAQGTGSARENSGRFPVRRTAALSGAFAAVLAIVLAVVFSTHDGRGSQTGATGTTTSNQTGSRQPSTSGVPTHSGGSPTAGPATGTTVCTLPLNGCTGYNATALQSEPSEITVSEDGAAYIKYLTWSGWGTATATGTGTLEADNCNPNCAQGHDTPYAATVTVSHLVPYGNGEQAYSTMAVSVPGSPSRSETFSTRLVP
jgi:serine/threonine protein kinase